MSEIRRETLDRRDLPAFRARDGRDAGAYRLAIEVHRASAAQRHPASEFCSSQCERFSQDPQQWRRGIDVHLDRFPIYEEFCHA